MTPAMEYSAAGLALTKCFEGLRLTPYQDTGGVWTIGYGHTGPDVHAGRTIDEAEATALLMVDLQKAVDCVNGAVTTPLKQGQFDALVDFTYNAGCRGLLHSTLLRRVNAGELDAAAVQYGLWVDAGGEVVSGLVRRRAAEAAMFRGKEEG
jgi:lysozyme